MTSVRAERLISEGRQALIFSGDVEEKQLDLSLFPVAEQRISSALARMMNGAVPLFAALFARMLLRRVPQPTRGPCRTHQAGSWLAMTTLAGRVGSTRGSVAIYFLPVVAIVLGVVFRDESVAAISLAGTALIMAGAWLTSRKEARSPIPPPAEPV